MQPAGNFNILKFESTIPKKKKNSQQKLINFIHHRISSSYILHLCWQIFESNHVR